MFKLIKDAKDVLLDPKKRADYDKVHRAMLRKKAKTEQLDKRQRALTESLFAKEEEGSPWKHLFHRIAKRRRQGEMSAEEKRKYRISQVLQENEKIIQSLLQERAMKSHSERTYSNGTSLYSASI